MLFSIAAATAALLLQANATPTKVDAIDADAEEATPAAVGEAETRNVADAATAAQPITDKSHPDYVRCRSERVIGSLAKRTKTCKTNREWEVASRVGNRGARDIVESQQVGMNGQ